MSAPFLDNAEFPGTPSYGFISQPMYKTEIVVTATGRQERFRLWEYPLHRYTVTIGPRMEGEISELLSFYHAVGGEYSGFRFRDWANYKSCLIDDTPAATDQPLVQIGTSLAYQLVKEYTIGGQTQQRIITKPVASTILVAQNSVPTTTGWTLNASTGIITFGSAPTPPVTWGGLFDVPVRFDGDFPISLDNFRVQTVSFSLEELRPDQV
jgi:uncharacterized protein (TIGR02217 family)